MVLKTLLIVIKVYFLLSNSGFCFVIFLKLSVNFLLLFNLKSISIPNVKIKQ